MEKRPTSINVDPKLWRAFKVGCAIKGRTVTEQLERMIRSFVNKPIKAAKATQKEG